MRQKCNLLLNAIVQLFLETYPDVRYIQAMFALGIIDLEKSDLERAPVIDRFYEEPIDTLKRCRKSILGFLTLAVSSNRATPLIEQFHELCS